MHNVATNKVQSSDSHVMCNAAVTGGDGGGAAGGGERLLYQLGSCERGDGETLLTSRRYSILLPTALSDLAYRSHIFLRHRVVSILCTL